MGVTVIGGKSSSFNLLGLPTFDGRFKVHPAYAEPTSFVSGTSRHYTTVGVLAGKPNNSYAPPGNPMEYGRAYVPTHTGSAQFTPAGGSAVSVTLGSINASATHWYGGMWLTNGNIVWAASNGVRTIYIREYDTTAQAFISDGVNIISDNSPVTGSPSSNENLNNFGVLPNGTYYAARSGNFDFIGADGVITQCTYFNSSAIPVSEYEAIVIRDVGFQVYRFGHPTKPDIYFSAYSTQGRSLLGSLAFHGFDGAWNSSTGGSVYDGYVAASERCMIHQGDLAEWVSEVCDIATGETT